MTCTDLYSHSFSDPNMEVVEVADGQMVSHCRKCGYYEELPYSKRGINYLNDLVVQDKRHAADDSLKEMLQPTLPDGSVNDEFTEAYGYNPFDKKADSRSPIKAA